MICSFIGPGPFNPILNTHYNRIFIHNQILLIFLIENLFYSYRQINHKI